MEAEGRITARNWDLYDTRHVVYRPAGMSAETLKSGYDRAYRDFYSWRNISAGAMSHRTAKHVAKHFFYAAGWKKFEPLWDAVIRARRLHAMTPLLEAVLSKVSSRSGPMDAGTCTVEMDNGGQPTKEMAQGSGAPAR